MPIFFASRICKRMTGKDVCGDLVHLFSYHAQRVGDSGHQNDRTAYIMSLVRNLMTRQIANWPLNLVAQAAIKRQEIVSRGVCSQAEMYE